MITYNGNPTTRERVHFDWEQRTRQALQSTFGEPFQLWIHDVAWRPLDAAGERAWLGGDDVHVACDPPGIDLATSLDQLGDTPRTYVDASSTVVWLALPLELPESEPADPPATPGETWAALPVTQPAAQPRIVALGKISGANEHVVMKLAELFLRDKAGRRESERLAAENSSLLRQITHDFEELSFLRTMAELLDVSDRKFDVTAMAQAVLPSLQPLCEAASMIFIEADQDDSPATPAVWCGPRVIDDATCCRLVQTFQEACTQQPVVHNDFRETIYASQFPGVEGFILVPIVTARATVGWLLALNRENELDEASSQGWNVSFLEFGTHEASLMCSVSTILATHARNMDLLRERDRLVVSVVRALVTAIEAKDEYTRGHSERVALYAKRLAEELDFDAEYCDRLYLTGLLHDVGKIGVSDAVLRKPGALAPDELDEIKQHPDKGWAILADVEPLTYVLPGVLHHHEQFDGGGYPDGLAGGSIHIDGRILAVADAYDAMTSDRPYRQGMPHAMAEKILRNGSGHQWDAKIIEVFFRVVPDILQIQQDYRPRVQTSRKKSKPHFPDGAPAPADPVFQLD